MCIVAVTIRTALLICEQNAMNAAEITDKLGLHSLRQRAWVRIDIANIYFTRR